MPIRDWIRQSDLISFLFPEFKVGEGHAGPVNVAVATAARHPVQPAHVDASPAPETGGEHHSCTERFENLIIRVIITKTRR